MQKHYNLLTSRLFIIGLFVLVVNDHILKYSYPGFLTGKLSDISGLFIFPIFITSFWFKQRRLIYCLTGLIFIFWKLPISQEFIDTWNNYGIFRISRVVDYTDLIALIILPISYLYVIKLKSSTLTGFQLKPALIGIISIITFCATTVPRYEMPQGTVYIGESYKIKLPKDSVISTIKSLGYNCDYHKYSGLGSDVEGYYQSDNIIRYWSDTLIMDTIANVKYELEEWNDNKTILRIVNITLTKEGNIQNWKTLKSMSKRYNIWLKNNMIEKID
jgi:hypothetical protein